MIYENHSIKNPFTARAAARVLAPSVSLTTYLLGSLDDPNTLQT
jgi:hypothetical protein